MFVEATRDRTESHGTRCRGSPRPAQAAAWLVLALLSWGSLSGSGFGQEPPPVIPPAGAPNLEWPPNKPGLVIESDCFANAEIALVFAHLSSRLTALVPLASDRPAALLSLQNAHLDPTASLFLQLGGFRFGPGYPELAVSYRLMAADGTDVVPFEARFRSRLNFQAFGLNYLRNDCPLPYDLWLSWDVGPRLQVVFFDTQARSDFAFAQARNYFFGAGPHAGIGLTRLLSRGFGVFGHADAALIVGYNTAQNFTLTRTDLFNQTLSGSASQQQTQLSPSVAVQAGLTWAPDWLPAAQLRSGYQFEQYYDLGHVASSRGNLNTRGLFLNLELNY